MFPKRNYLKVAVNHITDLDDLLSVAKRFMIASEYASTACSSDRLIVAYPTKVGVRQTEMPTVRAYGFLRGAARLADLFADLVRIAKELWWTKIAAFLRYDDNRAAVYDDAYVDIFGNRLIELRQWLADNPRRVLWEHNTTIAAMVRSGCAVKAVQS